MRLPGLRTKRNMVAGQQTETERPRAGHKVWTVSGGQPDGGFGNRE